MQHIENIITDTLRLDRWWCRLFWTCSRWN